MTPEQLAELARLRVVAKWAAAVDEHLHRRGWISELDTVALNMRAALRMAGGRSRPVDGG